MRLYVMVDTVTETLGAVQAFPTDGAMLRALSNAKFPPGAKKNDFQVLYIGDIADHEAPDKGILQGQLTPLKVPKIVATVPAEDIPLSNPNADMMHLLESNNGK